MKFTVKWALALMLAALISLVAVCYGLADAGGFSGDSDFGGGSDWGSSSDWDSGGGIFFGDSDGGGGGGGGSFFWVVIAVIVIIFVIIPKGKTGTGSGGQPGGAQVTEMTGDFLAPLRQADPDFSAEAITENVSNMYVQLQNAWEQRKWEPIRTLMTDSLFNQFNRQLNDLIARKLTNHVDNIAVLDARIIGYTQDKTNDILRVLLKTRINDYYTDDSTGNVVKGDKNKELFMTYEWTLIRSSGVKTRPQGERSYERCPACGAPMSIKQTGQCQFCGVVVSHGEYDWVVSAIRGVSQQSGR